MSDLVAFLRARLDEDEETAKAAAHGPWEWQGLGVRGYPQRVVNPGAILVAETFNNPDMPTYEVEHIVRHDPARVLREVEAKRRILDLHHSAVTTDPIVPNYMDGYTAAIEVILRDLATVYSDHPDYDPAWA